MRLGLVLAAALAASASSAAEGEPSAVPSGRPVEDEAARSAAVEEMKARLAADPALAQALADRVLRSRLAAAVTKAPDAARRRQDVLDWIAADPDTAAEVAAGLAKDDDEGTHRFEDSTARIVLTSYVRNPNAEKGSYGTLKRVAGESKLIGKAADDVPAEQRREALRALFEGQGSAGDRTLSGSAPGAGGGARTPASATPLSGFDYGRLSAANLRGYSPRLLALQSALNAARPPGAPRLVETGRLDYATLAFPAHGMRWDAEGLESRLGRDLGGAPAPSGSGAAPRGADAVRRLEKRRALLARIRKEIEGFEAAAARGKDPAAVTKALLLDLEARRREAARWIAAAALEEELFRVETDEDFLTPELLAAIDAVPAPEAARLAYKRRGEVLRERLRRQRRNAERALAGLESPRWTDSLGEVERLLAESRGLRRDLPAELAAYRRTPFLVAESRVVRARWRAALEDLAVKWAPRTAFAREASARKARFAGAMADFFKIAAGD